MATSRLIALTGGIASGKTLVETYLAGRDIPVEDADAVVHRLLSKDDIVKARIRQAFGGSVFSDDGTVDRRALGALVFENPERRQLLESWLHPAVREALMAFRRQHAENPVVVVSIPLLFESDLQYAYPEVWLLVCEENLQMERLMTYRGLSREEALARIYSQMPMIEKQKLLNEHPNGKVILNRETLQALYQQVDALLAAETSPPSGNYMKHE